MINKQFAVVRFFDSTGLGKSTFHYAHDVDCSDVGDFGMYMDKGLLALYGIDVDRIVTAMGLKAKYVVVCCPKNKLVDDEIAKLENAVWVDPEAIKKEEWYAFGPTSMDHSLFRKVGEADAVPVVFSKPEPVAKVKPKPSKKKKPQNGSSKK